MSIDFIFAIAILIISVVIHEVSHGYVAYLLGDPTAKYQGRLTLNPIPHIDPIGSILVPFLFMLPTFFGGSGFILGWARPVPYNPYNLSNQKWGPALVAAAGPSVNILIAVLFGLTTRFGDLYIGALTEVFALIAFINLVLAVFNLIPIPPLDGSKVLFSILPYRYGFIQNFLERYGFIMVLVFIFSIWRFVFPFIIAIFHLITGAHLLSP